MVELPSSFDFMIELFSLKLTVRKASGLVSIMPFEVYERHTLWNAATHIQAYLAIIGLTSRGTTARPKIKATVFWKLSVA